MALRLYGDGNIENVTSINTAVSSTELGYLDGVSSAIQDQINLRPAGVSGSWTTNTPTLTGSGWSIGNGVASTRYAFFGKTVFFITTIIFGSTSTFGNGWLEVSLPVPAQNQGGVVGFSYANDNSSGANYTGLLVAGIYPLWITSTSGSLDGTISSRPFTWSNTDTIRINGFYEAA